MLSEATAPYRPNGTTRALWCGRCGEASVYVCVRERKRVRKRVLPHEAAARDWGLSAWLLLFVPKGRGLHRFIRHAVLSLSSSS